MITVVIIEDEKNVGNVMRRMLESNYPDIKVKAVCANVKEAEEMLNLFHPDLVFLDVELGKSQTCFDLLKKVSPVSFSVIFTTAYSRAAMQAFKLNAIDYLMKPIDAKELNAAIEKFKANRNKIDSQKIDNLISSWANSGSQQNKMQLTTAAGYDQVTISDIIFCEEVNGQTAVVLKDARKTLVNMSLRECEDILTPYRFYKIQKYYLVNLNHIKSYTKSKAATTLLMSNDVNLNVSIGLKDTFLRNLKSN